MAKRLRPGRALALLSAPALVLIAAAVVYFIVRGGGSGGGKQAGERAQAPAAGRAVEPAAENIRHFEFSRGRLAAEVRALKSVAEADGSVRLEGDVLVRISGGEGEAGSEIRAERAVYNPSRAEFSFFGPLEARRGQSRLALTFPGAAGEPGAAEEAGEEEASAGTAPVGTARALSVFNGRDEKLIVKTPFRAELTGGGRPERGFILSGGSLAFDWAGRRGEAAGGAALDRDGLKARAGRLSFRLSSEADALEKVELAEGVRLELGVSLDGKSRVEVEAVAASVFFSGGTGFPARFAAEGGVGIVLAGQDGTRLGLSAASAEGSLDESGSPAGLIVPEAARAEYLRGGGAKLAVSAAGLRFDVASGTLAAGTSAEPKRGPVSVESEALAAEGDRLSLDTVKEEFVLSGKVKGYVKPGASDAASGMFEPGETLFFLADEAQSSDRGKRLGFEGKARLWQGSRHISAESIELDGSGGGFLARGAVSAGLTYFRAAPQGEKAGESPVAIACEEASCQADSRRVDFRRKVIVSAEGFSLASDRAEAVFSGERNRLETLEAYGPVRLARGGIRGEAGRASFSPASAALELAENPSLTDAGGRLIRGDKLTLTLTDDRILLEKRGKGRSSVRLKRSP